jgi:hypothetical protein
VFPSRNACERVEPKHTHTPPPVASFVPCHLAVPWGLPMFKSFEEYTGLNATLLYNNDSLYTQCMTRPLSDSTRKGLESVAKSIGMGAVTKKAFVRMFQNPAAAVGAISNLAYASITEETQDRTVHIVCALARLNAVIWLAVFLFVIIGCYLCCCWPCLNLYAAGIGRICIPRPSTRQRNGGDARYARSPATEQDDD